MSEKLSADLNIIQSAPIELELLDGDLNIIQKLDDEPNDVGGLTSAELKAKFDESGNIIKKYINETLIPAVLAEDATEESRKQAEAARVAAEQTRQTNEDTRKTNEAARVAAEQVRQTNEETRKTNEAARVTAEGNRATAEGTRANAETARVQNETERKTAEASRASAETARANAETQRAANETARQQAETQRQSNEAARQNAESQRVIAENARNVWEDYSASKAYAVGNKVAYGGSSYLCIKPCTGIAPPNAEYWRLIAAKGNDGKGAPADDTPKAAGTANAGVLETYSRGDHVHPKEVSDADRAAWNGKGSYSKPTGGIPKADLASAVQSSLDKADRVETLVPDAATEQNQLADKLFVYAQAGQVTPLFANSTADCTDTTKVYVLPDGYIYGYINGAWTNTGHQFTNAETLEKIIDATCDIETISGGNYNLLKVSEVSYSSRLQDNVAGIVASTATNIVTGWIPVREGKYYAVSALVDGIKDAAAGAGRDFVQRINAKKADGTILVYNKYPSELCTELSRGKAYSVPADATHMMFHIQIQGRTQNLFDISTSAKLKEFEPMIVEGDTAALAVSNSIDFAYVDGDEDIPFVVNYALKHDPYVTAALFSEQTDVVVTKIGAEIGRSLTTEGSTNPNLASVTTAFLINRPGATITVSSNAYRFQVSEFSAKSDSALVIYSGVLDYGTTFTTGASPYIRIAIRNVNGDTADLNILDNITISVSEQSNFVSANRRMDDIEYRLRSVEDADASPYYRNVDYHMIPTSYYKGVGTDYDTTFGQNTSYTTFITAWKTLITGHGGYVAETELGNASDNQKIYLYDFKPSRITNQRTNMPKIVIVAGQHGTEKSNVYGLYYFVSNLLNKWNESPVLEYLRNHVEIMIIPVLNTYGFDHFAYKNANGVNLNRNYDANWVLLADTTSDQYGGAAPFDQPETQIVRDLLLDNDDASLVVDFHTNGNSAVAQYSYINYYGVSPNSDAYFNRLIDAVAHQLASISANFNLDYSLNQPDTVFGWLNNANGVGLLRDWATENNFAGVLVEGFNGFPNGTPFIGDVYKANEEIIANWLITALNYLKG